MSDEAGPRTAEYVLGLLAEDDREAFARAIDADPALAEKVVTWNARLAPLSDSGEVAPPAEMFDRISERIATRSRHLPDTITIRADEGMWIPIAEGVERKMLWSKGPDRRETYLVRAAPGARFFAHNHADDEEGYLVSGDLTFDTLTLHAGDFHLARKGVRHPIAVTRGGCVLLVSTGA